MNLHEFSPGPDLTPRDVSSVRPAGPFSSGVPDAHFARGEKTQFFFRGRQAGRFHCLPGGWSREDSRSSPDTRSLTLAREVLREVSGESRGGSCSATQRAGSTSAIRTFLFSVWNLLTPRSDRTLIYIQIEERAHLSNAADWIG